MKTEKRIVSGVFVGFISYALNFVQSILIVPILLTLWGKETYGIWLVLNAGYLILQTLDSGQQAYIGNEFNIKYFSNKKELRIVLGSSIRIAFLIGILQLLIVTFLILTNTTHLFLGLDALTVSAESLNVCLLLLIFAWIASGTYASILSKLMIPYGYYSKNQWWGIYNKIGSFVVLVIIVLNHGTILDATIGTSIYIIFFNFLLLLRIKNLVPDTYPWWHFGDWKIGWQNLRRSSLISVGGILSQFSNNGLILLITNLFGSATVPLFSTIRTITNSAVSLTNLIIQPLQPEIVKFRMQKELKRLLDIFDVNWLLSGLIVNVSLLLVLPFIDEIYTTWTRGRIQFDFTFFLLLAASVSFFNFGSVLVFYLHSLNKIIYQFIIILVKLLLIFSISILLSESFGLIAVGIGVAVSELLGGILLPYLFIKNEFNSMGVNFSFTKFLIKLTPILILIFFFVIIGMYPTKLNILVIIGILLLGLDYTFLWKSLPLNVRAKIILLIRLKKIY